jgi:glycogen(starch) synthase
MTAPCLRPPALKPARVLMLSWEYPPVLVGGLGRHVHALATTLATAGHDVTVVTRHAPGAPLEEYTEGVRVLRAPEDPPSFPLNSDNLLAWAMAFNHTLTRTALRATQTDSYDVVHAHDWLVTHAAVTMRDHLALPLVATIHATEAGRHQGWLPEDHNRTIHSVERWLAREAVRVIVCSDYMKREVGRLLDLPAARTDVVHNGVDVLRWHARPRAVAAARHRFVGPDAAGPLVSYAGRLVYEKGVQHLIAALPRLRLRHPDLRMVIAGDGPYRKDLEAAADALGVQGAVTFAGFLGGHDLTALMGASDCYVVPSIYEPFGMVALEAAAVGTPVAVADTGGLAEIVEEGVTGVKFPAQDPDGLADAVSALLLDREYARTMARRARRRVREDFNWPAIASRTARVYDTARARDDDRISREAEGLLRSGEQPPRGNLLAGGHSGLVHAG